jgi:hypothetical protein
MLGYDVQSQKIVGSNCYHQQGWEWMKTEEGRAWWLDKRTTVGRWGRMQAIYLPFLISFVLSSAKVSGSSARFRLQKESRSMRPEISEEHPSTLLREIKLNSNFRKKHGRTRLQ